MLEIEFTRTIRKDLKRYQHRKEVLLAFDEVIKHLAENELLSSRYRDHYLTGNWVNFKECHVRNDVLLIYQIEGGVLYLVRLGSHSELF